MTVTMPNHGSEDNEESGISSTYVVFAVLIVVASVGIVVCVIAAVFMKKAENPVLKPSDAENQMNDAPPQASRPENERAVYGFKSGDNSNGLGDKSKGLA